MPELSEQDRRRAGRLATLSSCCGVTGETALTDSAVIILFAAALDAGDFLTLISTSMLPFFNGLFILPAALLATKVGHRRMILAACGAGFLAYLAAVAAPFAGEGAAVAVLVGAILLFTLTTPGFIACWNPLLDFFLRPEERVGYLGKMRFLHQLCAIGFLGLAGWFIGRAPSVGRLQLVLLAGAFIYAGRGLAIAGIPGFGRQASGGAPLSGGLVRAARDRDLDLFAAYQFVLNLLIYGGIPVAALYMKNALQVPGNLVVHVSNAGLIGMLAGYLAANALKTRVSAKRMFVALHYLVIAVNFLLAAVADGSPLALACLALLLGLLGFAVAASSVYCAAETMRLAPAGNKIVAMAWSCAFFYCGSGCSRLFSSFLLKSGHFCTLGGEAVSPYRMLFCIYGLLLIPALALLFRIPAVRGDRS